jgi:hypothetical protein
MGSASVLAKVAADIERFGWHCLSVAPRMGESGASFTYTIGLWQTLHHAELAIFGLAAKTSHGILSDCVTAIRSGVSYPLNTPVVDVVAGNYRVEFKRARSESFREYFGTATRYYGTKPFEVNVIFWPDRDGRFRWETHTPGLQEEALHVI